MSRSFKKFRKRGSGLSKFYRNQQMMTVKDLRSNLGSRDHQSDRMKTRRRVGTGVARAKIKEQTRRIIISNEE